MLTVRAFRSNAVLKATAEENIVLKYTLGLRIDFFCLQNRMRGKWDVELDDAKKA
jgi:hypothetical protein